MDMMRTNEAALEVEPFSVEPLPLNDVKLCAKQTIIDVVQLTLSARKALGEARLATVTKCTEFMRMIFGDDSTEVAAGGGYYCQECMTQPKYDYHWWKAKKCGSLSGWFCAKCGHSYYLKFVCVR